MSFTSFLIFSSTILPLIVIILVILIIVHVIKVIRRSEQRAEQRLQLDRENTASQKLQMATIIEMNHRLISVEKLLKEIE
ncbi:hypothetical protein [Paraliobacillus sediminis]|uniref:hypothetical protein n=1 Tax=Paraliobacillus sediminis TaxID=1885916 RepID=UPI000E3D464A|nr:hypothetical protein [Paraliobacillus sediminis]